MDSWGYLSGLLRAEKVHTLTDNDYVALAETVDVEALAKSLEDTVYGTLFQGRSLKEFSDIFDNFYEEKFQKIKEITPCPILTNIHALKVDLNNIKLCYKAKLSQKETPESLSEEGTMSSEKIASIVEHELWNELPRTIAESLITLSESGKDSARRVDFLIDRAFYAYRLELLEAAASYEPELYKDLLSFYRKEVDCENIKNIFRAKKMGLEKEQITEIIITGGWMSYDFFMDHAHLGEEDIVDVIRDSAYGEVLNAGISYWATTRSCTVLEKQIDEYLLDQTSNFLYHSSGPAVIEETLRLLDVEIKNLKLIIIGKLNNMSTEEIKERVRNVRI